MVNGLDLFLRRFRGMEDCFILIGGTACDVWMNAQGLSFRTTKDLDVVLVAEALRPEFFETFWAMIHDGDYESHQRSESQPCFYRFKKPASREHPFMIELFTRNYLNVPADLHLTPVPAGEDISSLSAILLSEPYYRFVVDSRTMIDGVSTIPVQCLIPLKARAYLDLLHRKEAGEHVDSDEFKKHRNDVFRLFVTLVPADRHLLPDQLRDDLGQFLHLFTAESEDWPKIQAAVKDLPEPQQIIGQLRENFGLAASE
jgi:hypothetical protein